MRRRTIAVAAASVAAGVAAWALWPGANETATAQEEKQDRGTATAERRDLVERETLDGTLGFAGSRSLVSGLSGTLTAIRREGSIVDRGGVLYRVDDRPVVLMYGDLPAWRSFASGMSDGEDVRQLERNLVALGYDPGDDIDVDREFDWATREAIERMQRDLGIDEDGTLDLGEIVFTRGAVRVGAHDAEVGNSVGPGTPIADVSSTDRVVTVDIEAGRQDLVRRGDRVVVEMPDGERLRGVVANVGRVAEGGASEDEDAEPTVPVTIRLLEEPKGRTLDQAPVDVDIEVARAEDTLAVPITALLALAEGGYAVEVVDPDGTTRLVAVETGTYADGWVEITGNGISDGTEVVVPE